MERWKCKICSFLLFFLVGQADMIASPGAKKQLIKEVHESFEVNFDALLGVQNKYGDITITTWDQNTIDVDILIKVKTSDKSRGQTFLEGINIDFSSSRSKVGMETTYPDQENSSWWSSWWSNSDNLDFEVHYTIKAPEGISTKLYNKYGTISQASIEGSSHVVNKFGDIYLNNVGGDVSLNLGYGKAKITRAKNVNVEIKNSTLSIVECLDISITSKYSDFIFGTCGDMSLDSKFDEFIIESAGVIENEGKFDDFKIGEAEGLIIETKNTTVAIKRLNKICKVETKYGSVNINSTGPNLELISLESKHTEYNIGVDSDFRLMFLGEHSNLSIDGPYEKDQYVEDGSDLNVKAHRGSNNANLKISAELRYGSLKISKNN